VPYQGDLAAALQEARWQAFRNGDYYREAVNEQARSMTEDEYVVWSIADAASGMPAEWADDDTPDDEAGDEFVGGGENERLAREEWRAAQMWSGTHSVIDMDGVSDEPAHLKVTPASEPALRAVFGTLTPSTAAVEAANIGGPHALLLNSEHIWAGTAVVSYAGTSPERIFFAGISGD
jgi:hypothetical protein